METIASGAQEFAANQAEHLVSHLTSAADQAAAAAAAAAGQQFSYASQQDIVGGQSSSASSSSLLEAALNSTSTMTSAAAAAAVAATAQEYQSATPAFASKLYEVLPSSLQYGLYDFWEMFHNPELNKYALFNGGPWLISLFVGSYLYFVLRAGPKMMQNRAPYDLKPLIRVYNFGMVLFNAYLFYHASPFLNFGFWCWGCTKALQPMVDASIPVVWLVLVSRFFDFFDTVFFVLRKKNSHVSFLHVFHHSIVPIGFWIGIKFAFFPVCCFVPYLNLVVHVIMYSYYGLSTFGPAVQRYLWWKKYLTRLQIAQFIIALVHSLQPLYLQSCTFPFIFVMGQTAGALLFLWLFVSFYIQAYARQRSSTTQAPNAAELQVPEKHKLTPSATTTTTTNTTNTNTRSQTAADHDRKSQ